MILNDGYARLASSMSGQIKKETTTHDTMELGTLQADGSLKIDRFVRPLPQGQYLRCRAAELLEPGKRVLVAWTNGGADPIVIDEVIT